MDAVVVHAAGLGLQCPRRVAHAPTPDLEDPLAGRDGERDVVAGFDEGERAVDRIAAGIRRPARPPPFPGPPLDLTQPPFARRAAHAASG